MVAAFIKLRFSKKNSREDKLSRGGQEQNNGGQVAMDSRQFELTMGVKLQNYVQKFE